MDDVINMACNMGVMGRNSDNTLIRSQLNWEPKFTLNQGLEITYNWIFSEIKKI
jgi:nucleoside-diphosphate-sugar epimerase